VLQLLAEGLSNKEVATQLNVGLSPIETHRANLMQKLNLHSTAVGRACASRESRPSHHPRRLWTVVRRARIRGREQSRIRGSPAGTRPYWDHPSFRSWYHRRCSTKRVWDCSDPPRSASRPTEIAAQEVRPFSSSGIEPRNLVNRVERHPHRGGDDVDQVELRIDDHYSATSLRSVNGSFQALKVPAPGGQRPKLGEWRRERDSNPRNGFPFSGFQDHRHRPLGHPSRLCKRTSLALASPRVGALMRSRRVDKGEAHESTTVDYKMKISTGKYL
jgi:regulatory LuxR family protein